MTALVATVFLASLAGSLHCAGMCGAFGALAVGSGGSDRRVGRWRLQVAYHGGRLLTYGALGLIAGALGAALDLGGALFGLQRAALAVAGTAMIAFGVTVLLRLAGIRVAGFGAPRPLRELYLRVQRSIRELRPGIRAFAIGLASTLLPCGWLWAFVVTAAGTGGALLGGAAMALFWAGTLPVMAGITSGAGLLAGPLRRRAPLVTALALVIVGLVAVAGRFEVPPPAASPDPSAGPACHAVE